MHNDSLSSIFLQSFLLIDVKDVKMLTDSTVTIAHPEHKCSGKLKKNS